MCFDVIYFGVPSLPRYYNIPWMYPKTELKGLDLTVLKHTERLSPCVRVQMLADSRMGGGRGT